MTSKTSTAAQLTEDELTQAVATLDATPDDDQHRITLYGLPVETVDALLKARGFEIEYAGTGYGDGPRAFYCIRTPGGRKLWHRSEALSLALVAEAQR